MKRASAARATRAASSLNVLFMERRTHVPLATLAAGFNKARDRFVEASGAHESEASFQSLFEALAWAGAIYDRLRGRHDVAPELRALWFVRNLVIHQGADVLLRTILVSGSELGMAVLGESVLGSATQWGWKWAPRQLLPEPQSLHGAAEYDSHVADHVVTDTLEAVSAYLDELS